MGQAVIVQNCQRHGRSNAVVAAQSGAVRPDPLPVTAQIQPLRGHVFGAARSFFTNHIQMPLENDGGSALVAGGRLFENDHVISFIPEEAKLALLGKTNAPLCNGRRAARAARNGGDFLKPVKNRMGL